MTEGETARAPRFGKVRYIIIASGEDGLGEWKDFRRNLIEDYKMLFDNEEAVALQNIGWIIGKKHIEAPSQFDATTGDPRRKKLEDQ